jgi:hypothetical protein
MCRRQQAARGRTLPIAPTGHERPPAHAYAVGQPVRSLSSYHRGEVGTVIARHPGDRPAYVVQFAGDSCVYLIENELELPDTAELTP